MNHIVFVFTCGDEYLTNCSTFPATKLSNEEIKKQMTFQAEEIKQKMIEILTSNGIKEEIAVNIPHCITSSRSDDLPTGQWVDSLWEKCESKCRPEAKQFVNWIKRHPYKVALGATVAVAAGVITTAVIFCAANSSSQSQATHASGPPAIPSTPFSFSGYKPIIDLPLHNNIFGGRSNNRRLKAIGVGALGSGAAGVAMGITSPLVTKDFIIRRRY
uniref:Uncharacterized protein n=1 Tax=Amphimedon queenslandica TaxID=400682 RepID=A0A1X7SFN2_AMPQE